MDDDLIITFGGNIEEPTANLRFVRGRLQQMWLVYETRRGVRISMTEVWRDVPEVSP